jgi:hypothetical protein
MRHIILVIAIALAACAAPLTQGGGQARQIQPNDSTPCKFLGVVDVTGNLIYSSATEARRDMLARMRNETAQKGGNAFAVTMIDVERGFSLPMAQADAYRCP